MRISNKKLSAEISALKIHMIELGLSMGDLAKAAGISRSALIWNFGNNFPRHLVRARVEAGLDYLPFWSSPTVIAARKLCLERLSYDPYLLSKSALLTKAKALSGLKINPRAPLDSIRQAVLSVVGTISADQRDAAQQKAKLV